MKNTLSLLFLLFISTILNAQHFSFGIETGVISSTSNKYSAFDFENRRDTYYSGLNTTYYFNQSVSATVGFHYLRQGDKEPTPECYQYTDGIRKEMTVKRDYLIIPLTVNFHLGNSNKFLTSIGVFGGYNVKAFRDYPKPISGCKIGVPTDLTHTTADFIFGGIVGAGYKVFENDKFQVTPMIKYYQGISNTFPKMEPFKVENRYSSALLTLNLNYKIAR
ncbi:outer membrane beta-barrel protein [Adhaeribacter soli]|nr:outer membrane beta-barrel protein [Adhaeribacter soli]